ncbi:MAG: DUF3040 domain-containing protein [Candidatus Actinomarinales bacterium]|nr:MAG: DUF3040 domain-containing protein [Candidatus Actinomarinales bacterium]
MSLNEKEKEILKEIEENLFKDDPNLAQTVETTTLSGYSRSRSLVALLFFLFGLLAMFGTYIVQPAVAIFGFIVMAISGYLFVTNTKLLLRSENITEWNLKTIYRIIRN